jgi:hypothetical protein
MTTNDEGKSVFAQYIVDDKPPKKPPVTIPRGPLLQPIVAPADYKSSPVEKLLDFLVNHWSAPTIRAQQIHWRGPNCVRNRKTVSKLTRILVEHGWLARVKARRRDTELFRIVREPSR